VARDHRGPEAAAQPCLRARPTPPFRRVWPPSALEAATPCASLTPPPQHWIRSPLELKAPRWAGSGRRRRRGEEGDGERSSSVL
jgi:hypothetical protein